MRWLIVCLLVSGSCASSADDRGTLEAIPRAAATALDKQSGGAAKRIEREAEGGVEMYEASWVSAGRKHEAKVTADGRLVEYEVEVPASEVPERVKATAVRVLGAGASYVMLMNGHYEAELVVDGKEKDVVIAPDGTVVGGDDDDDDDEDDD